MAEADTVPRVSLRPTPRELGLVTLFTTGIGLALFAYRYLGAVADGRSVPIVYPLVTELTGAYTGILLYFGVRAVALRHRIDVPDWHRPLPAHLLAVVLFGLVATSLMWGSRVVLFPLVGLGRFDYGRMPHRYFMEFPVQVIVYCLMVFGVTLAARYRAQRERALRAAQLEAQLSRARLQALELQLQPHFLFNALNTVGAVMYEDPAAADEMLGHLAELLRTSLRADRRSEVALSEELEALDHYLAVMRARFGDRLEPAFDVEPETLGLRVPALLLQPLVENAVRHGGVEAVGRGRVAVRAWREGERLRVEVRDDGPPAPGTSCGTGLGLSLTRERLELLYGPDHTFSAGPAAGGGFLVSLSLPGRAVERRETARSGGERVTA